MILRISLFFLITLKMLREYIVIAMSVFMYIWVYLLNFVKKLKQTYLLQKPQQLLMLHSLYAFPSVLHSLQNFSFSISLPLYRCIFFFPFPLAFLLHTLLLFINFINSLLINVGFSIRKHKWFEVRKAEDQADAYIQRSRIIIVYFHFHLKSSVNQHQTG